MLNLVIDEVRKIYFQECGRKINDEKLMILLYFIQRNYYAQYRKLLFKDNFLFVKNEVMIQKTLEDERSLLDGHMQYSILNTIRLYSIYETWYLFELAKKDESFYIAYKNQDIINYESFKVDAEKVRVYDALYDCYLDELDDFEEFGYEN